MSSLERSLAPASETDASNRQRVHRKLVHKADLTHVFVERIEALPPTSDSLDRFLGRLVVDTSHPFFFEHPLDHVPGLMLIEGTRQVGTAISHLFYDVPFDLAFILNRLDVRFTNFAELTSPVAAQLTIVDKTYRHQRLSALACHSQWLQDGRSIGTMDAQWSFSSPAVLSRLRQNAATAAPAAPARPNNRSTPPRATDATAGT